MRRQVSPQDCTSTSVSRPFTVVVVYGPTSPRRTSRHTGALLPGWVTARCCCALTESSDPAGGFCCCANAAPAISRDSNTMSRLIALPRRTLLADALVFVLRELALLDRLFPALLVSGRPLAAAQLRHRRLVLPRRRVGLALVLSLLVDDDLLLLAAGAERQRRRHHERETNHDLPPVGAAGCCGCGC